MWLKIFIYCVVWLHVITTIQCHLPPHIGEEVSRIESTCNQAKRCIHDTIPVCGSSLKGEVTNKRTFYDLCDLYEYVCDNEEIWKHTPDETGCPNPQQGYLG